MNIETRKFCKCGAELLFEGEKINGMCDSCTAKQWRSEAVIEEQIQKKCSRCQKVHNAPGSTCFACMRDIIGGPSTPPQRVGIARKGDLVILECVTEQSQEDRRQTENLLGKIREEMGISFLVLDAGKVRLARVTSADERTLNEDAG